VTEPPTRVHVSKLFLSVDLTGSTAFKQRPFDPKSPWQKVFLQFYREFPQVLHQQQQGDPAEGLSLQLWKAVGDELLFTCEVHSERDIFHAVRLWIKAMRVFTLTGLRDHPELGVKGAAFLGTFPGPDHESTIPWLPDTEESGRDVLLLNEEAVNASDRDSSKYLFDFFGPSIDTGFRICSMSKPRYMPLSLEVAYALAVVQHHHDSQTDTYASRDLKLLESIQLKGVWGGREYPVFALDLQHADAVHVALAALRGDRHENAAILKLCASAHHSVGWPCAMYLRDAITDDFKTVPDNPLTEYLTAAADGREGVESPTDGDGEIASLPPGRAHKLTVQKKRSTAITRCRAVRIATATPPIWEASRHGDKSCRRRDRMPLCRRITSARSTPLRMVETRGTISAAIVGGRGYRAKHGQR
jgi:hypothetical protein